LKKKKQKGKRAPNTRKKKSLREENAVIVRINKQMEAPKKKMNNTEPVNNYKHSITRKKIGLSLLAPTALLFILGRTNLDMNSPNYGNDRSGFTFAGVVTGGTSLYCLISSRHQLKKAERKNNSPVY